MIKLQHLAVIFIAIMLPMSLILSAYTQMQIDTLTLQQQCDANLKKAAYDAIKAFDLNTTGSNVSDVADSLRDNINSSITTFIKSFATTLGVAGYSESILKPYIPAILFTLYDGYYIYAPTYQGPGQYEHMIQPYNYYGIRYTNGTNDVVINYTLDNYIAVYGWVNSEYVARSGYLVSGTHVVEEEETLMEGVPLATYSGSDIYHATMGEVTIEETEVTNSDLYAPTHQTQIGETAMYERNDLYYIDPESAKKYNEEATEFTNWVTTSLSWIRPNMARRNNEEIEIFQGDTSTAVFSISSSNNPEVEDSDFNQHRIAVIQNCVEDDLNYAITAYAREENETNYNYRLPQLTPSEWVMISSNVCMVPFVQGLPVGSRFYNNYAIVKSSTNKFFAEPENIFFVDGGDSYHRIDCPELGSGGGTINGFSSYAFQPFFVNVPENPDGNQDIWYWRHKEQACYYCIVSSDYDSEFKDRDEDGVVIRDIEKLGGTNAEIKKKAYYTAVARERYRQYRTTNYLKEEIEAL